MQRAECFMRRLSAGVPLGEAERAALHDLGARPAAVPGGHDLVLEGEPLCEGVIFERGWGCRYALLEDGRRQVLQLLVPGDHVGDSGAIFGRADHSVATLTPARVLLFPAAALAELSERLPRLGLALEWSRFRDRSMARARLIDIGRRSGCQRTAHLILELHLRLRLVGEAGEDWFILPLTQELLADALGMTTVHVNRMLRRLRQDRLIDLDHGRLTILARERLIELAEFDDSYLHHAPVRDSVINGLPEQADEAPTQPPRADRAV